MDGSSVYKQSGGVEWIDGNVPYAREGRIAYEIAGGSDGIISVLKEHVGCSSRGHFLRYAYLDPAPPSEPRLKWHLWSESRPEGVEHIIDIDTSGAAEGSCYDGERRPSSVWWAYAPCSSKYGE